jgi:hypothetical protein
MGRAGSPSAQPAMFTGRISPPAPDALPKAAQVRSAHPTLRAGALWHRPRKATQRDSRPSAYRRTRTRLALTALKGEQARSAASPLALAYGRRNVLVHQPNVVGLAASWVEDEVLRSEAYVAAELERAIGAHESVEARPRCGTAVLEPVAHVIRGLEEGEKEVDGLLPGHSVVWVKGTDSPLVPAFDSPKLTFPALLLEMVRGKAIRRPGHFSL